MNHRTLLPLLITLCSSSALAQDETTELPVVELDAPPPAPEPCAGVDCSGHGRCELYQGVPYCNCDSGYQMVPDNRFECQPNDAGPAAVSVSDTEQLFCQWPDSCRDCISRARYFTAGMTTFLLGFGIGHAIARVWTDFGWVFTVTEVVGLGLALAGIMMFDEAGMVVGITGGVLAGAAILWEKIDIWVRPDVGPTWCAPSRRSRYALAPMIANNGAGVAGRLAF